MLKLAGKGENISENKKKVEECISSGQAYQKMKQWIQAQEGDIGYIEDTNRFEKAKYQQVIYAKQAGYISKIVAGEIGEAARLLGAGRNKKEDTIDYLAGIALPKKVGDFVEKGECLATIYTSREETLEQGSLKIEQAIQIVSEKVNPLPTILEIIE